MEDTKTKRRVIHKTEWEGWLFYGIGLTAEFLAGSDQMPMDQPFVRGGIMRREIVAFFSALDATSKKSARAAVARTLETLPVRNKSMGPILDLLVIARSFEAIEVIPILQSCINECELNKISGETQRKLLFNSIMTTVLALAQPGNACAVRACIKALQESGYYSQRMDGQITTVLKYVQGT